MTINFHCTACRFKILLKSQFILADGTRFTFGTTYNSVGMMSLFINLINVLRRPSLLRHLLGKACLFSLMENVNQYLLVSFDYLQAKKQVKLLP